jgi:hypothetical protein
LAFPVLRGAGKKKNASRADAFFAVSALLGPPDFDMPARKIPKIALGAEKRGSKTRPAKRPENKIKSRAGLRHVPGQREGGEGEPSEG